MISDSRRQDLELELLMALQQGAGSPAQRLMAPGVQEALQQLFLDQSDGVLHALLGELSAWQAAERSDRHHLEVFLARTALGASPVHGHLLPGGAGRNAFVRRASLFVIDPSANQAHPGFHSRLSCQSGPTVREGLA